MESLSLPSSLQLFLNHHPRLTVDLPPTLWGEGIKILMERLKERHYRLLLRQHLSLPDQQCRHPHPTRDPLLPQHQPPQPTLDLLC